MRLYPTGLNPELYEPLPHFILAQASAIGAAEPPTAARDYVEVFVKGALADARSQHVDRVYDRKVKGKVLLLDNPVNPAHRNPPAAPTACALLTFSTHARHRVHRPPAFRPEACLIFLYRRGLRVSFRRFLDGRRGPWPTVQLAARRGLFRGPGTVHTRVSTQCG